MTTLLVREVTTARKEGRPDRRIWVTAKGKGFVTLALVDRGAQINLISL